MNRSILRRALSGALSVVLFVTNAALASAPEANFWAERRRRAEEAGKKPDTLLASLPASQVLSGLPSVRVTSLRELTPALAEQIRTQVPKSALAGISSLVQALPAAHGQVRRLSFPPGRSSGKTVVHIQDVHQNLEAQKNIAASIQGLADGGKVQLVALEGAFEPIDLGRFHAYPDKDALKIVADDMLLKNEIPGPVYMAMTSPQAAPPFVGVDDRLQHSRNVDAYKNSTPLVASAKQTLSALQKDNAAQKANTFSPALLAFDEKVQAYRDDRLPLGEYVQFLASSSPSPLRGEGRGEGEDVRNFLTALKMETALDFPQVEKERARLIDAFVSRLDKPGMEDLLNNSLAYRSGQIGYGAFYRYLQTLCRRAGVDLSQYPALRSYIDYVLLADRVNAERLFRDVTRMEKESYARLAKTDAERRLAARSKYLHAVANLLDFALTPEEWGEYKSFEKGFPLPLDSFEAFYVEADNRNRSMVENLLSAMDRNRASTAVLVTGGFHTDGMEKLFQERGVACLTVTPTLTHADASQGGAYLTVFTREKTPLEKIFEGEKLFVAKEFRPALARFGAAVRLDCLDGDKAGGPEGALAPDVMSGVRTIEQTGPSVTVRTDGHLFTETDLGAANTPRFEETERDIPLSVRQNLRNILKENSLFLAPILAGLWAAVRHFDPQSLATLSSLGHELSLLAVVGLIGGGVNLAYHYVKKYPQQLRERYGIQRTTGQITGRLMGGYGINAAFILPAWFAVFHGLQAWLHPAGTASLVLLGVAAAIIAVVPVGYVSHAYVVNVAYSPDVPSMADLAPPPTALAPYTGRWHYSLNPAAGPQDRARAGFAWFQSSMEEAAGELRGMPQSEFASSHIRERLAQAMGKAGVASIGVLEALRKASSPDALEPLASALQAAARDAGSYERLAPAAYAQSQDPVPEARARSFEQALSDLGWAIHPKTFLIVTRDESLREPSAILPAKPAERRATPPRPARAQAPSSPRPSPWRMLTGLVQGVAGLVRPANGAKDAPPMADILRDMISRGRYTSAADYLAYWRHGGADLKDLILIPPPAKMAAVLQRMDLGVMTQVFSAAAREVKSYDAEFFEPLAAVISHLDRDTQYDLMAALLWKNQPLAEGILHGGIWGREFFLLEDLYQALQSRGEIKNMVPLDEYETRYRGEGETASVQTGGALELTPDLRKRLEAIGAAIATDRLSERQVLAGLREELKALHRGYLATRDSTAREEEFRKMAEFVAFSRPLAVLVDAGVVPEKPKFGEWSQLSTRNPPPASRWEWLGDALSAAPAQATAQTLAHFLHAAGETRLRQGGAMLGRFSTEKLGDLISVLNRNEPFPGARQAVAEALRRGMQDEESHGGRDRGLMRKYLEVFQANAASADPLPMHELDDFLLTGALLETDLKAGLDRVVARCVTEIYESNNGDRRARALVQLIRAVAGNKDWGPFPGARRLVKGKARKAFNSERGLYSEGVTRQAVGDLTAGSPGYRRYFFSVLHGNEYVAQGVEKFEKEGLMALGDAVTPENYDAMLAGMKSLLEVHKNGRKPNQALKELRNTHGPDWVRSHWGDLVGMGKAMVRGNPAAASDLFSIIARMDRAWLDPRWDALVKAVKDSGPGALPALRLYLLKPVRLFITPDNLPETTRRLAKAMIGWKDDPDLFVQVGVVLESLGEALTLESLVKVVPTLPDMTKADLLVKAYDDPHFVVTHWDDFFKVIHRVPYVSFEGLAGLPEAFGKGSWMRDNREGMLQSLMKRTIPVHMSPGSLAACQPFLGLHPEPWEWSSLWDMAKVLDSWPPEAVKKLPERWWAQYPEELGKSAAAWEIQVPEVMDYSERRHADGVDVPEYSRRTLRDKTTVFVKALHHRQALEWLSRNQEVASLPLTRAGLRLALEAYDLLDRKKAGMPESWQAVADRLAEAPPEEAFAALMGYLEMESLSSARSDRAGQMLGQLSPGSLHWMIAEVAGKRSKALRPLLETALRDEMYRDEVNGRPRDLGPLLKRVQERFEASGWKAAHDWIKLPPLNSAEDIRTTGRLFYTDQGDLPESEVRTMIVKAFDDIKIRSHGVEAVEALHSIDFKKVEELVGKRGDVPPDVLRSLPREEMLKVETKGMTEGWFNSYLRSVEDNLFDTLPPESPEFRRLVINLFHVRSRGEGGPQDVRAGLDILSKRHLTPANYSKFLQDLRDLERSVPPEKKALYYKNLRTYMGYNKSPEAMARFWPALKRLAEYSGPLFPELLGSLEPVGAYLAGDPFEKGKRLRTLALLSGHPEEFLAHAVPFLGRTNRYEWPLLEAMAAQWDHIPSTIMGPGKPISREKFTNLLDESKVALTSTGDFVLGTQSIANAVGFPRILTGALHGQAVMKEKVILPLLEKVRLSRLDGEVLDALMGALGKAGLNLGLELEAFYKAFLAADLGSHLWRVYDAAVQALAWEGESGKPFANERTERIAAKMKKVLGVEVEFLEDTRAPPPGEPVEGLELDKLFLFETPRPGVLRIRGHRSAYRFLDGTPHLYVVAALHEYLESQGISHAVVEKLRFTLTGHSPQPGEPLKAFEDRLIEGTPAMLSVMKKAIVKRSGLVPRRGRLPPWLEKPRLQKAVLVLPKTRAERDDLAALERELEEKFGLGKEWTPTAAADRFSALVQDLSATLGAAVGEESLPALAGLLLEGNKGDEYFQILEELMSRYDLPASTGQSPAALAAEWRTLLENFEETDDHEFAVGLNLEYLKTGKKALETLPTRELLHWFFSNLDLTDEVPSLSAFFTLPRAAREEAMDRIRAAREEVVALAQWDFLRRIGRARAARLLFVSNERFDDPVQPGESTQALSRMMIFDIPELRSAVQLNPGDRLVGCDVPVRSIRWMGVFTGGKMWNIGVEGPIVIRKVDEPSPVRQTKPGIAGAVLDVVDLMLGACLAIQKSPARSNAVMENVQRILRQLGRTFPEADPADLLAQTPLLNFTLHPPEEFGSFPVSDEDLEKIDVFRARLERIRRGVVDKTDDTLPFRTVYKEKMIDWAQLERDGASFTGGTNASDIPLVLALPFVLPWLASFFLTALGIKFDPKSLGFLPALAAVLSAVVVDELGHMAQARRLPRIGLGGILGPRIYVPGASGWSGLAARLGALAVLLFVGHVTAPVAAMTVLAGLLVSLTDVADVVRQSAAALRALKKKPAQDEPEFIAEAQDRLGRLNAAADLSKEELGAAVQTIVDEMPTPLGVGYKQYAAGDASMGGVGSFLFNRVGERVEAGDARFLKTLAGALRGRGLTDLASLRRFLARSLTGTHVYLEDAQDLAARPEYWKALAVDLRAHFAPQQYAFIVPDEAAERLLLSYGFAPESIHIEGAFEAAGRDGRRKVEVDALEDRSVGGSPLGRHSSVTIHATPRMELDPARVKSPVLREAADKENVRLIDFLNDLPLSRAQLELIDRVAAAILAAA